MPSSPRDLEDRLGYFFMNTVETMTAAIMRGNGFEGVDVKISYSPEAGRRNFIDPEVITNPAEFEEARERAADHVSGIFAAISRYRK